MTVNTPNAERECSLPLQIDIDELFQCINGIRMAYTHSRDRQPLSFETDERRGSSRVPLMIPVAITPVVVDGRDVRLTEGVETISGLTIDLSLRGMGFTHVLTIEHRHAAVTFSLPGAGDVSLLVELRWTKRDRQGRLQTGARFLGVTNLPVQPPAEHDE